MLYLENLLINPSNKPSYVLCYQGSNNLKWLVRGRRLVLVVATEHRYVEEQRVFHLWRHRKNENKGSANPYTPNAETTRPSFSGIESETSQPTSCGSRIVGETGHSEVKGEKHVAPQHTYAQ